MRTYIRLFRVPPPTPQVVDLGEWVPWEFQSEDHEAPSNSENSNEVVPNPPPCKAAGAALSGMKGPTVVAGEEQQQRGRRDPGVAELIGQVNFTAARKMLLFTR